MIVNVMRSVNQYSSLALKLVSHFPNECTPYLKYSSAIVNRIYMASKQYKEITNYI